MAPNHARAPRAATTVLGTEVASPILIAPTAYHQLADPEGECATARAAAAAGSLYVAKFSAGFSIDPAAAGLGG